MEKIFASLVTHFGGQEKTAGALSVHQTTVSGWVCGKHGMSPVIAMRAEALTSGKFKASDLCPQVFKATAHAA